MDPCNRESEQTFVKPRTLARLCANTGYSRPLVGIWLRRAKFAGTVLLLAILAYLIVALTLGITLSSGAAT
jgi:hypothetical protein